MGSSTIEYKLTPGEVVRSRAVTNADIGTTVEAIHVPAYTLVEWVRLYVVTAFAGGTPTLDVGDGDNDDGWVDQVDITEATIGMYLGTATNGASYAATGKYYSAADTIDVKVSSELTAGKAYVIAKLVSLADVIDD